MCTPVYAIFPLSGRNAAKPAQVIPSRYVVNSFLVIDNLPVPFGFLSLIGLAGRFGLIGRLGLLRDRVPGVGLLSLRGRLVGRFGVRGRDIRELCGKFCLLGVLIGVPLLDALVLLLRLLGNWREEFPVTVSDFSTRQTNAK